MNTIHRDQLLTICRLEAEPAVSLYLPSVTPSAGSRQEPKRLRNLLRAASAELRSSGLAEEAAYELLLPARALVEDQDFWAARPGGVALFVAPGYFHPMRVDFEVPELVRVGRRFTIRPLLPLLDRLERFYVLALSIQRVRLIEVLPDGAREVDLPGLPGSFEEAMGFVEYYSGVSAHSSSHAALGRRSAIFHGHGDDDEENREDDLRHFFRRVTEALERALPDPTAPIVPAAVAEYFPLLRGASRRLRFVESGVEGNPDLSPVEELAAAARACLELARAGAATAEATRWRELLPTGRSVLDLEEIARAAEEGRVETLLLATGAERWGRFDPDLGQIAVHETRGPGDEELLDRAASRTLAQGGTVVQADLAALPERRVAAAILRYATVAAEPM